MLIDKYGWKYSLTTRLDTLHNISIIADAPTKCFRSGHLSRWMPRVVGRWQWNERTITWTSHMFQVWQVKGPVASIYNHQLIIQQVWPSFKWNFRHQTSVSVLDQSV